MVYFLFVGASVVSFAMGWAWGYGHGRQIGWMVGEELERREWKRRTHS